MRSAGSNLHATLVALAMAYAEGVLEAVRAASLGALLLDGVKHVLE